MGSLFAECESASSDSNAGVSNFFGCGGIGSFPVGLPPVELGRDDFPGNVEFRNTLAGAKRIALSDGGVLENLGIQTLLKSERVGTWNMIVSDAGVASQAWAPGSLINPLRSFGIWVLSGRILDQLMLIMNDKQNCWARQQVIEQVQMSWLADALRSVEKEKPETGVISLLGELETMGRRGTLFVRVDQDWNRFLLSVPEYRLRELERQSNLLSDRTNAAKIGEFLTQSGVDLSKAREYYYSRLALPNR